MRKGPTARRALCVLLAICIVSPILAYMVWANGVDIDPRVLPKKELAALSIRDNKGVLLREQLARPDGRNYWVPLEQISADLINATIASEDQRFWQHDGVDLLAFFRAVTQNIGQQRIISGASTLTMQLARVLDRAPQRRWTTKARQVLLAKKLELVIDKRAIVEQYLNRVPYGNGTFGVEAASRRYFDKPAAQLSLGEAATLAGLPRSPSGYNPFKKGNQRLLRRKRYILWQMLKQGYIDENQHRLALAERPHFRGVERSFRAPHFVSDVIRRIQQKKPADVRSTIDHRLQKQVELAVTRTLKRLEDKRVTNAAVIVVDNASSSILAYVGSADFLDKKHSGQVDGSRALRQPGSALKPFTYALALESGYTPATLLPDLPAAFSTPQGVYHPQNYSRTFHGPVRLRAALANSYNVPAIRTARFVGVGPLLGLLHRFGFSSLKLPAEHYGLGLTLGNGEVNLQELVAAYAALARGGKYKNLRLIEEVRDVDGKRFPYAPELGRRVLSKRSATLITHMLSDAKARIPAFGRDNVLSLRFDAAAKTGTSKDFRDNWTVGYTPRFTVGVWVGNFDGSSMHDVSGITGAGPLWAAVMNEVVGERRDAFPAVSSGRDGIAGARICLLSGALATPHCEQSRLEFFFKENSPQVECQFHEHVAVDQRNGLRADGGCPARHQQWVTGVAYPPLYRDWANDNNLVQLPYGRSPLCQTLSPIAAKATPRPAVRSPRDGAEYYIDPDLPRAFQSIDLRALIPSHPDVSNNIRWLVDGKRFATRNSPRITRWQLIRGRHRFVAESPSGERSAAVHITVR
jgi:penicillin-binding protein 1C